MGYTKTSHYDQIIERHIRSGRASNETETIHQALTLLDAVSRGGPRGSTFSGSDDLDALLLDGLASATGATIIRVPDGTVNWRQEPDRFF